MRVTADDAFAPDLYDYDFESDPTTTLNRLCETQPRTRAATSATAS